MKLIKFAKIGTTLPAILSIAILTLAIGGCGSVTEPTTGEGGGTAGSADSSFTVTPGAYQRYSVEGDGKISFTVKGIDMDLDKDAQPIVCFYDGKGYTGGRGGAGFNGELRNYKLKYYSANGRIASESYHGSKFHSEQSYNIVLEWKTGNPGYVQSTINGSVFQKAGQVPESFTLGIGYPPAVRRGWDGAVYTNIVWPKGSTAVK